VRQPEKYNQTMTNPFVPPGFIVPEVLEKDNFRLRMLKAADTEKDYDAVMTSIDHLQGVFGKNSTWPSKDLTLEQDRRDLEWHQNEFLNRLSFTYTVMDLDETICLGCVYIFPSRKRGFEADVTMWVRKSEFDKGFDPILYKTVKHWITDKWPFKRVRYPGRE
jgi:hypothetical protein